MHLVYSFMANTGIITYYTTNMNISWTRALVGNEGTSGLGMVLDNNEMVHLASRADGLRYAKFPQGYTGE